MSTRITQRELESYLWDAAIILRGLIDAGDYKQYIFPLVFLKRISDVYDEEFAEAMADYGVEELAALPENHRFVVPDGCHWRDIRQVTTNIGTVLRTAMRRIEDANPDTLPGVFGDGDWGNKNLLPDSTLSELIEHFSSRTLSIANLPEDELGNGYEYLIKKFADDSGHTAQEFYTNRTLVHLMTQMLEPESGESVYDPTCGTGGMLISAAAELKRQGKEWRNLRLYGQERNFGTSAIARMNLFLHGIVDGRIEHGDTLAEPKLLDADGKLQRFDVVLANPPYSIKDWNRGAFASDPYGRNMWEPRRRAAPTTPSSSTSRPASTPSPGGRRSCSHTGCCSAARKPRYGRNSSSPTSSNVCSAWARACSTTARWRLWSSRCVPASRKITQARSCSSTRSTRSHGSRPNHSSASRIRRRSSTPTRDLQTWRVRHCGGPRHDQSQGLQPVHPSVRVRQRHQRRTCQRFRDRERC
jgi:hypothetical protein